MSLPTDNPVRDERTPPGMDVQAYHDASVLDFGMDALLRQVPARPAARDGVAQRRRQRAAAGHGRRLGRPGLVALRAVRRPAAAGRGLPGDEGVRGHQRRRLPGLIWPEDRGFGDWCPPDRSPNANGGQGNPSAGACFSERSLVNTALSYRQAEDVAKAARALGRPGDAAHFADLAAAIAAAFNAHFLDRRHLRRRPADDQHPPAGLRHGAAGQGRRGRREARRHDPAPRTAGTWTPGSSAPATCPKRWRRPAGSTSR